MLTKFQAIIAAFICLSLFIVSLTLDLHGAIAVIAIVLFFVFLSASIIDKQQLAFRIMRIVGWLFLAGAAVNLLLGAKNIVFAVALFVCGAVLAFDKLSSWLVRSPETE